MIQRLVSSLRRSGRSTLSGVLTLALLGALTTGCSGEEGASSTGTSASAASQGAQQEPGPEGQATGEYRGYFCPEGLFILTQDISAAEALENCQLNAASNPEMSVLCTWNGEVIFTSEQAPGVCNGIQEGQPEARPVCGLFRGGLSEGDNMIASPNPPESVEDTDAACLAYCDQSGPEPGDLCVRDGRILTTYGSQPCNENGVCAPGFTCDGGQCVPEQGQPGSCAGDLKPAVLDFPPDEQSCEGPSFVRWSSEQNLWVGAVSCGDGSVRLYLAESEQGPFLPALDTAGHGQDHCELLVPGFTLGNEDDIASGSCASCSTGPNIAIEGKAGYVRSQLGEPFVLVAETGAWSYQTSRLSCGCDPASAALTP
jgi:hypothetical protein